MAVLEYQSASGQPIVMYCDIRRHPNVHMCLPLGILSRLPRHHHSRHHTHHRYYRRTRPPWSGQRRGAHRRTPDSAMAVLVCIEKAVLERVDIPHCLDYGAGPC